MSMKEILNKTEPNQVDIKITYDVDMIFVEGDSDTLEFIGKLFIEMAKEENDCGLQLSPSGAGKAYFNKQSRMGIYIHRLPCANDR